jgi:hypothetical protein
LSINATGIDYTDGKFSYSNVWVFYWLFQVNNGQHF